MKHSFIRFLLVGIVNTIVGLSTIFVMFYVFHFSYWIATLIGNVVGAFVSYVLNKSFTFRSSQSVRKTILPFFIVMFACYFVSYFIGKEVAYFLFELVSIPFLSADDTAILLGSGLYTITNYFGQKQFVFSYKIQKEEST
jgi:putative flippase GtrA